MGNEKVIFVLPTDSAKDMCVFGPILEENNMDLKFYDNMKDDQFGLIIGDKQFLVAFVRKDE